MSSMRTSAILSGLNTPIGSQQVDLSSYFKSYEPRAIEKDGSLEKAVSPSNQHSTSAIQGWRQGNPAWKKEVKSDSLSPCIYKEGTLFQIHLLVEDKPTNAEEFYKLAKHYLYDQLTLFTMPSFDKTKPESIQTLEELIVSLLMDASDFGYGPARKLLAELQLHSENSAFQEAIQWNLEQRGYSLSRNKEIWIKGKALRSIAEFEDLQHQLRTRGPVGRSYFLTNPFDVIVFQQKLQQLTTELKQGVTKQIHNELNRLLNLVTAGNNTAEDLEEATTAVLKAAKEARLNISSQLEKQIAQIVSLHAKNETVTEAPRSPAEKLVSEIRPSPTPDIIEEEGAVSPHVANSLLHARSLESASCRQDRANGLDEKKKEENSMGIEALKVC